MANLKFSIIICTFNGAKKIKNCLEALEHQTYPKKDMEIIVINDGSNDDTASIITQFEDIRFFSHDKNYGLGKSRNTGIFNSSGDIIVFTDDDCIPDKNWIENLAKCYSNPNIDGVGGKIEPYNLKNIIEKYISYAKKPIYIHVAGLKSKNRIISYFLNFFRYKQTKLEDQQQLYSIMGANSSYRRKKIEDVNGCDDHLRRGVDWDLNIRLHKKSDINLKYCEKSIIFHQHRVSLRGFIKHMYEYGKAQSIVSKKHKFFNYPYPLPSLIIFFSFLFLFTISFNYIWLSFLPYFLINYIFQVIFNLSIIFILFFFLIYAIREIPYSIIIGRRFNSLKIILLFPLLEIIREFSHCIGSFVGYFKKY